MAAIQPTASTSSRIAVERLAGPPLGAPVRFSFGTLLTNRAMYDAFRATLDAGGFTAADCEFLVIDNTSANTGDGYAGLNAILNAARGDFVVLCHQDLLLIDDRAVLEARLAELDGLDPSWAVAGNAGGVGAGEVYIRITDGHGDQKVGVFPQKVRTVDENFIVTRRDRRVAFSHDLAGFHLYGADLCTVAGMLGYASYVIDFHLQHLGKGNTGPEFFACRDAFQQKWSRVQRLRGVQSPCTFMFINPSPGRLTVLKVVERTYYRIAKKIARPRIRRLMRKHLQPAQAASR